MSAFNGSPTQDPTGDDGLATEGGLRAPPGLGFWGKVWWWFHFLILVKIARLRFVAVLFAIGAVIVYWDTLKACYDKYTRPAHAPVAVAGDVEYFCPMHPQIVRDNLRDKCPICFMPLSKRKKGEGHDEPLPPGTVSRVQLSPYRVVLAGIQTAEVGYRRLTKEVTTVGSVEFDERKLSRITVRAGGKSRIDKLYVNVTGQAVRAGDPLALVYNAELATTAQILIDAQQSNNPDWQRSAADRLRLWGIDDAQIAEIRRTRTPVRHLTVRSPMSGQVIRKYQVEGEYVEEGARLYDVADLSTVWVEAQVYEPQIAHLREGLPVSAATVVYPDREFAGRVALIQTHLDAASRTLRVRFDLDNPRLELRPGMYATVRLQVPVAELGQFTRAAADVWRDRTAVDLAAHALANPSGFGGGVPGVAPLVESAVDLARLHGGLVLAVPEGAVIDTGSRKVVYREAAPGVYEGVEVQLGPRTDLYYPVVRGLAAGERVVAAGSFLIDAETRLNPAAGSIYFGGSGGSKGGPPAATARPSMAGDEDAEVRAALAKLPPEDRRQAEGQGYCPVLGTRLGGMGTPVKVALQGRAVFLCCKGCEAKARASEGQTLDKVEQLKRTKATPVQPPRGVGADAGPSASRSPEEDADIRAALAELAPEDRRRAEAQRFCPVQGENRLGTMGPPVKVVVKGQPVFLCCKGCRPKALADPDGTLDKAEKLRHGAAH
jgi:Cu(I)/Ag(I) efflux system membrane fusion protein